MSVSEGLAQGPYMAARAGFEPTTLRSKGVVSTNAPRYNSNQNRTLKILIASKKDLANTQRLRYNTSLVAGKCSYRNCFRPLHPDSPSLYRTATRTLYTSRSCKGTAPSDKLQRKTNKNA